jgi:hypothetical protein
MRGVVLRFGLACAVAFAATGTPAVAQPKKGAPPAAAQEPAGPPPLAAPKPYKAVPVTAAAPMSDTGLDALRKQLADIAAKKDRAALASIVVAKGFFWERQDGKKADAKKSGADNLAAALNLQDPSGWEGLAAYASEPSAAPAAGRKGAVCSPAPPQVDQKALAQLAKSTGTDAFEWAAVTQAGTDVREKADAKSPALEKVDMVLVRVYDDPNAQPEAGGDWTRIVTPSGKVGFVPIDAVRPLQGDQLCYVKEGNGWKIGGYVGGGGE